MKIRGDAAAAARKPALLMNVLRDILFTREFSTPLSALQKASHLGNEEHHSTN
jgi:hypothetical protein